MAFTEVDLTKYDLNGCKISKEEIKKILPHRFEFEQLDAILDYNIDEKVFIGVRQLSPDDFWVRGHVPGMPLFPGVLMIESCAQLCALMFKKVVPETMGKFIAFAGVDNVRFRGSVGPHDKLILVGKGSSVSARACKCKCWALLGEKVVFEGEILGIPIQSK